MHEVFDGRRTLKFDGALLAFSTSYRPGRERWVEFSLFRTVGGTYILSRVGQTNQYHMPDCPVAERNGLNPTPRAALNPGGKACHSCRPDLEDSEQIAQELPRYYAATCDNADCIVESLYQDDNAGSRYLTGVARRLLDEASKVDEEIDRAYRVEIIL